MEDQQAARCVLWCAAAPPAPLLDALARRRVIVTQAADSCRALATLCRLHSDRSGLPPVLLLVEPSNAGADLVRAAWTYAPRSPVWMYEAASNPALRGVVEADVDRWSRPVSDNSAGVTPKVVVVPGAGLAGDGTIARIGGPGTGGAARARENMSPARASGPRLYHDPGVERGAVRDDDLGPAGTELPARQRPLLSPEELDMLLAEQPEQGHG